MHRILTVPTHKRFRVTHPYHPLFGQEFELIEYRNSWGEERAKKAGGCAV